MYFVAVMLSAQSSTVPRSIASAGEGWGTVPRISSVGVSPRPEPTIAEIEALVGPATPHFAYQLRARVRELVLDLPEEDPVRKYAEEKMELLDRLRQPPADEPLPRR